VDIINPGNVKFELGAADLILNKRYLPVLGQSLVFMIIVGSGYETVLKDLTRFFFIILFSYFQDPGRVSKICKK